MGYIIDHLFTIQKLKFVVINTKNTTISFTISLAILHYVVCVCDQIVITNDIQLNFEEACLTFGQHSASWWQSHIQCKGI